MNCDYLITLSSIFIFVFLLFPSSSTSQITKLGRNIYKVNADTLHYFELSNEHIAPFAQTELYVKSIKSLKNAKAFGWGSIGVLGAGALAIALDNTNGMYCDTFCLTTGDIIGILSIFLVTPITGTIALISEAQGRARQKKLIHWLNDSISLKEPVQTLELSFTSAHSGLGLGLQLKF